MGTTISKNSYNENFINNNHQNQYSLLEAINAKYIPTQIESIDKVK
jgi:hypothetical protein